MNRLIVYFARISWLPPHAGQEEMFAREPIRDAVTGARSLERYGHQWVLGNLQVDDERGLVLGRLGYPEMEHRTQQDYDRASQRFVEQEYDLPDAVSGAFALGYRSGEMAFDPNQIGPTGFVNHFVAMLNAVGDPQFKGELARQAETYREFLKSVDKITRVSFEVRPTNPRDRRIFRPLDEGMRAANATRQKVVVENQDEGLVLEPPDSPDDETTNPAVMGIEMNEDGYGEGYKIDGHKDGQPVRFDSTAGGSLVREVIEGVSDDPDERARVVEEQFVAHEAMGESSESPPKPSPFVVDFPPTLGDPESREPIGEMEGPNEGAAEDDEK